MQTYTHNMIAVFGLANWDFAFTVALSIGIFATVFMLVVAIFSQSGTIQMSPLREAAIATGHDDRKTIFENPYVRPLLWLLLALSHRVRMPMLKNWLRQALISSGNPSFFTAEEYLAMSLFNGIVLGLMMAVLHVLLTGQFSAGWLIVGIMVGMSLTLAQLYSRASARLHEISRRVPYALDLISLAMGAGATFIEAVRTVAREDRTDPFNVELNTMLTEIDLGASRRKALENLGQRVPLTSLRSIVASVIQAEELGTPLSDVLHAQASLLRLQRTVQAENAAAVASVRILVPSLLILISVVLTLFAPAIIRFVRNGGFF